jgi:hypothetical protein
MRISNEHATMHVHSTADAVDAKIHSDFAGIRIERLRQHRFLSGDPPARLAE